MLENAEKITHISFIYEKVYKTDILQPYCSNGQLVFVENLHSEKVFRVDRQLLSVK